MVFVACLLGALGGLILAGFIVLQRQIGALTDELRDARKRDGHSLAVQLDSIADKQQGTRFDLSRMERELTKQEEAIRALSLHIEGPPSLRHPPLSQ